MTFPEGLGGGAELARRKKTPDSGQQKEKCVKIPKFGA